MSTASRSADRTGATRLFSVDCRYRFRSSSQMEALGAYLSDARNSVRAGLTQTAGAAGVAVAKLSSWERGTSRPSMTSLRRLRDALGCGQSWLESALKRFYVKEGEQPYVESGESWARLWALVGTRVGSMEEQRAETTLMRERGDLAAWIARRFRSMADAEDLGQISRIALLRAIRGYVPTIGPFTKYAVVSCRGAILGYLSDRYYEGLPSLIRNRHALVRRASADFFELQGRMPTESELDDELPIPRGEIRDALRFHWLRRTCSLDEEQRSTGRTLHEIVECRSRPPQDSDGGRITRVLDENPDTADEIAAHLGDPTWVQTIAARAEMSADDVARRLHEALHS